MLATLKGLPFAYNRDLQEDKEPTFDAVETLLLVLPAMAGSVATLRFDTERMAAGGSRGLRPGHRDRRVAGAARRCRSARPMRSRALCVRAAEARGVELWDLTDEELAAHLARR